MSILYGIFFFGGLGAIGVAIREIRRARDARQFVGAVDQMIRINELREAVEVMQRCRAVHVESVPVIEMFGEQTVWEGVVEVFDITEHPQAERCYAWSFPEGAETRFVTVLEIPPVESPQTAVRASIASEHQQL